ncbi:hypothetical protein DPMN_030930 [Dreissena polymorpha]|uniref:Uncharacterized protein n=1 Tax=Dreissena polymorpha TaxID=45954 RepID=A0A9D4RHJ6_DREPO|nr:hypothetical protein DPMN_030930 [Dreissena polymorpha]
MTTTPLSHHERREAIRSDQLQVSIRNSVQGWYHKNLYWRPSKDESLLGLDTSPGTTVCARLFSRER